MKTAFRGSFLTDVRKVRGRTLREAVARAIEEVEQAASIDEVRSVKRLSGHRDYYRIRIGDWRVGLKVEGKTAWFVRCLHRREMYRFFP